MSQGCCLLLIAPLSPHLPPSSVLTDRRRYVVVKVTTLSISPFFGLNTAYLLFQSAISFLQNTYFSALNLSLLSIPSSKTNHTETILVDEIAFPTTIASTKQLSLLGHGITDIEIHFLQIKFTAIGVYLEPEVVGHLQQWKGKSASDLAEDDDFFAALIAAPVEKVLRVVTIKEIKGSQYGVQLESSVRDRLVENDKYEDEEEEALEKVVEFFQSHYFKKGTIITFCFPSSSGIAEITLTVEGKESKIVVENVNLATEIKNWYLGGTKAVSPTTIASLANTLSVELCK